MIPARTWR